MDKNQAQFLAQCLCKLWEGEFPATCKVLAAVPDDKRSYRPDEKSRSAWELATHSRPPTSGSSTASWPANSCSIPRSPRSESRASASIPDVVAYYKKEFPAALGKIRAMPADKLAATVDFFGMMQMPNVTYLGFANNHSVHHRGQLAAYLRAMGSKVPAIYGASADEPMSGA